jgi:hypothetical protein
LRPALGLIAETGSLGRQLFLWCTFALVKAHYENDFA